MGSGSSKSSQVHSFQKDPDANLTPKNVEERSSKRDINEQAKSPTPGKSTSKHSSLPRSEISTKRSPSDSNQAVSDDEAAVKDGMNHFEAQEKIKALEKQLTESESQNLDLQQRVQMLEERLDYLNSCHQIPEEGENYEETIKAKDQYITKIEKDQKSLQDEISKLKLRHKKRVKNLTKQLNEAKQETSIQMFELKDEITRLREENSKLKEEEPLVMSDNQGVPDIGKMQVVLELSNQITELHDQIAHLEKELRAKDDLISKLHQNSKSEDYNKEVEQRTNLQRLSTGLNSFTKSKNTDFVSDVKLTASEEEFRGISGASRDSGFGSAGKNKRVEVKPAESKQPNPTTLSDSDWESEDLPEQFTHSKIHSAPAETMSQRSSSKTTSRQSGANSRTHLDSEDDRWSVDDQASVSSKGSRRSKKKVSLTAKLKRENDSSLRTPVPSMAFEDNLEEFNDIPMYPSNELTKSRKKKKSSFFLTQGTSSAGSDRSESLKQYC